MNTHTSIPAAIAAAFMLATATTIIGCQDESSAPPPAVPLTPFVGITSTEIDGSVIAQDPDDWKPIRPASGGIDPMHPAYPNPCTSCSENSVCRKADTGELLHEMLHRWTSPGHIPRLSQCCAS